jgi:hypothetical protein
MLISEQDLFFFQFASVHADFLIASSPHHQAVNYYLPLEFEVEAMHCVTKVVAKKSNRIQKSQKMKSKK